MDIYENINYYIKKRGLSKREFASKLISLEPKSNRTGEVISEKIIYSYLSGKTSIKVDLIPFISEVLNVPEQFLFEDSEKVRLRILDKILKNPTSIEKDFIKRKLLVESNERWESKKEILELLTHAPESYLKSLRNSLREIIEKGGKERH